MTSPSSAALPPVDRPSRPPLRRSGTEKMLGGICGGLGEHTGTDQLLWRIGFVALAVSGTGLIVYLALWVLLPPPSGPDARTNVIDDLAEQLHEALNARTPARR